MAASTCMNVLCGTSPTSAECRRGWVLRSGESAALCRDCGSAYEQSLFCEVYHSKETGWRECTSCGKRLHCGCIVSRSLLALLDSGGVNCINCAMNSGLHQHKYDTTGSCWKMKLGDILPSEGEIGSIKFSNVNKSCSGSFEVAQEEVGKVNMRAKDMYESLAQKSLSITPGTPISNGFYGAGTDERENNRTSSPFQQEPRSHHLLPKAPKPALPTGFVTNANMLSQIRVARPPAQGRGRNQLLPRYWPRITDQELQQISVYSNSTIVPLFEKVLSASDAGRIGRLVLPKACAEAYFPPISQPEGLPLRILDIKGKEWAFQFRFWPNNNSRMYVLEGVTPCIQSMQLQAGDTVTFSRKEPEGKLVMGFRKASNSVAMQDIQPSAIPNGPHSSEYLFSGDFKYLALTSSYSGLLQSLKGSTDPNLDALSKQMKPNGHDIGWHKTENHEDGSLSSVLDPERKGARNIKCKSKRLLFEDQGVLELKLTWEEAQDLLRPPPNVKPTIFKIEDHEFEEYEEPPIFGKSSIFVVGSTGGQEQWTQCDNCMKWRRLPIDALLPSKWTCTNNSWDQSRSSCSAPEELAPEELENLLRLNREFKKQRVTVSNRSTPEHESSGLHALANAAILGVNVGSAASVATTTKHPRHRPGCSCIVCIQPPSGKGKHKPTCACNVCMTVKRRFKTLVIRKQKRQLENVLRNQYRRACGPKDEAKADNTSGQVSESPQLDSLDRKSISEAGKGQIDLNSQPVREEELQHMSMMGLLQVAGLPLDTYMKHNGLTNLASQQAMGEEQPPYDDCQEVEVRRSGAEECPEKTEKNNNVPL